MNLKNILITLSIVAVVLVAITFYVVFYSGGGTYVVSSLSGRTRTSSARGMPHEHGAARELDGQLHGACIISASSTTSSSLSTAPRRDARHVTQGNEALSITAP